VSVGSGGIRLASAQRASYRNSMCEDVQQRVPLVDDENVEEWERLSNEFEVRGVEAYLPAGDGWRVVVAVAEFIRDDPLESELVTGVETALRSVVGVTNVWHEDREQWVAEGQPSGRELVGAVAAFLDSFAERARPAVS